MNQHDPHLRRGARHAAPMLSAGLLLAGCFHNARLDARVEQIAAALGQAEAAGALRCAPRELATARSQLEFARLEREQGDASRAFAHLDVADDNVRAARLLSEPRRCGGATEAPDTTEPPPPSAVPTP